MTDPLKLSAVKVIATGSAGCGRLRATVIFTPPTGTCEDHPMNAEVAQSLRTWPRLVIEWLRGHCFKILLEARSTPDLAPCPPEKHCIEAIASGMDSVWHSARNYSWLEDLWVRMFACTGDTWETLRAVLLQATSQQLPEQGAPLTVEPVPQTDLSTLFEYNRVLELCDSIRTITESQRDCRVKERQTEIQYLPNGATADAQNDPELDLTSRMSVSKRLQVLIERYQNANAPQSQESPADKQALSASGCSTSTAKTVISDEEQAQRTRLSQIFYSLQSSPTLSRLFGLAIDVSFPASDLNQEQFFYLSVCPDDTLFEGVRHPIEILTQYRPGDPKSFWPSTHEESELAIPTQPGSPQKTDTDSPSLHQYRGIAVNQELKHPLDEKHSELKRRFELSSLDVRRAAEACLDRQFILSSDPCASDKKSMEDKRREAQELVLPSSAGTGGATDARKKLEDLTCKMTCEELKTLIAQSPLRPAALARKTYHTGGYTILDRARGHQAEKQRASRDVHKQCDLGSPILLCANDLLTGYRVDVGVAVSDDTSADSACKGAAGYVFHWRSLMARRVVYGSTSNGTGQIEHIAPHLFIEDSTAKDPEMGWRRSLEDGYLGLTARVIDTTAHAEEAIFSWTAEPMGAPTSGFRAEKVLADPLKCGRVVIAPSAACDPNRRIPSLRFGYHYRFALRSVYSGGISLPLGVAKDLYNDGDPESPTVIPAHSSQFPLPKSFRRFLRHERIDAPLLLLPEEVAMQRHGPMGYESAAHAVIRTVRGDVRNRQQPTITQRIFIAPGVSHSLAAMHGVFDNCSGACTPEGLSAPRFGPSGVLRDPQRGGFPMIVTEHIAGINGYPYPSGRHTAFSALGDAAEAGDMLYSFKPHNPPNRNRRDYVAYHPDPAALSFVIGVRIAGTDTYLQGKTRVIDAMAGGYRYPDTRPLLLTVLRTPAGKPRLKIPQLEDVVTVPSDPHFLAQRPHQAAHVPGAVEALLWLAPGDDFEVDVWCIPSEDELACRFALVESLAALSFAKGTNSACVSPRGEKFPCSATERFLQGLQTLIPRFHGRVEASLTSNSFKEVADWNQSATGPNGLTVPGPGIRKALASSLVELLQQYPLDEIAAFRTLRATHAIDRPWDNPQLIDAFDSTPHEVVSLERQAANAASQYPWIPQGKILFNWPTTSSLELCAVMASPSSDQLDDVSRGRSMGDRRLGKWPTDSIGCPLPPRKVYGFDVAPDGEVTLPKTCRVPLYRLDDLPLFDRASFEDGHDAISASLSLRDQFDPSVQSRGVGTGKFMFQFTDGLARQLSLTVTAYARHRDRMRTADPVAHNGKWLHQGDPLSPEQARRTSEPVPVWLNASVRPAEPSTRTPIPLFRMKDDPDQQHTGSNRRKQAPQAHRFTRTAIVRIPIARPWFSSGEDEHLGIVLWPPCFFDQDPDDLKQNCVSLDIPASDRSAAKGDKRRVKLDDFRDDDLGPGGKFITRWGGDPTRFPSERLDTKDAGVHPFFIPPSAFIDLDQQSLTGFVPKKIPKVEMPVRVEDDQNAPQAGAKDKAVPTLAVSLLAFRPKFDISEEQWYVDLALEHPLEAEPFVRFGLVRYQHHAPEDLRVSFPVVQWTQLLPRRIVDVQKSGPWVTIRVEGLATSPHSSCMQKRLAAKPSPSQDHQEMLSEDPLENVSASRMVARIIRETKASLDVPVRTVEVEEAFCEEEITFPQGTYQAVWCKKVKLSRFDPAHATYSVIVEERDLRLPASYPDEPVSPQQATGRSTDGAIDENLLRQSGLRFAAKVRLN